MQRIKDPDNFDPPFRPTINHKKLPDQSLSYRLDKWQQVKQLKLSELKTELSQ